MRTLSTLLTLLGLLTLVGCSDEPAAGGGGAAPGGQAPVTKTRYLLDQNATAAGKDEATATDIRLWHVKLTLMSDGRYEMHGEFGGFHGDMRGTYEKGDDGSIEFAQSEVRGNDDSGEAGTTDWRAEAATLNGTIDGKAMLIEMPVGESSMTVHFVQH